LNKDDIYVHKAVVQILLLQEDNFLSTSKNIESRDYKEFQAEEP
jgi:hypothetical protein